MIALVAHIHRAEKLIVDYAVDAQIVGALPGANGAASLGSHHSIDPTAIVAGPGEPLLHLHYNTAAGRSLTAIDWPICGVAVAIGVRAVAVRIIAIAVGIITVAGRIIAVAPIRE